MEIVQDFVEQTYRQQRQTLEIVEDFAWTSSKISHFSFLHVFVFFLFFSFFVFFSAFVFIFEIFFIFSKICFFHFFRLFFIFLVVRADAKTGKNRREVLMVKMTFFFCENRFLGLGGQGAWNDPFEGDPAFMFFLSLFSFFMFFVFRSNMFHCWHWYQSLTFDVSSAVSAPLTCGVLTTQGG